MLPYPAEQIVARVRALHEHIRSEVRAQLSQHSTEWLAQAVEGEGDTQFRLDVQVEKLLLQFCRQWAQEVPFILVAEGLSEEGRLVLPEGAGAQQAQFVMIVDPIDGTRLLMYDKRSAWCLTGIAPNRGEETSLADIEIAVQTELPTTRQHLADTLWAIREHGAFGERHNLLDGSATPFRPRPSTATDLRYGFASIANFFPEGKAWLAQLEESLYQRLGSVDVRGNPLVFNDQYLSTGGQIYELTVGHDRFVADLRPHAFRQLGYASFPLCAHPYDICTELIAREAGAIITDEHGQPLQTRLDIHEPVAWVGYANSALRAQIEPVLLELLHRR
ncbi:MAG: inositol monophosphatase [Armatimonadota bacterium]|nr:inositol monophosphatase [Armatimonadota bacterium]